MNQFIEKFKHITQNKSQVINSKEFNEAYAYKDIPVIFKQAFQDWKIKSKWTKKYLLNYLPQNIESKETTINVNDFFKEKSDEYLRWQIIPNSNLRNDFKNDIPDFFNCWYKNNQLNKTPTKFFSWLYIGHEKSTTPLHQDIWDSSAWNYLVSGYKLWLFYPKTFNTIIAKNPDMYDYKSIIKKNNEVPNIDIKPLICIQKPGDLVFTPGNIWHSVINFETSISVTENFINETNYYKVLSHFNKNNYNLKNINAMQCIVQDGFNMLK